MDNDAYEISELKSQRNFDYAIITGIVIIVLLQITPWINRYVEWKKKHGKGSSALRAMSRAGDRTLDYGGAVIGGEEPKIGSNCPGLTKAIDDNDIEWDLKDKKSSEVMKQVMINANKIGAKMPPKAKHEVKKGFFKRKKKVKE